MKLELTNRTKVLAVAVACAGAGAAAWFLYLEDWLSGPPAAPVAVSKPAPSVAKAPTPASKPAAPEAPKPAVMEASKPAPKPVPVSAPAPEPAKPAPAAKPAPVVVAQAPEPAKPMAKEPEKAAPPKEPAKRVARKPKPGTDAPKPEALPREAAKPAPIPAAVPVPAAAPMQTAAAPTVGTMRFNDLVTAVLYRDAGAVNDLLAFGKWPDKGDSRGMTPLMLAAMLGHAPIAEALLKAGANPNRPGPGGDTAMSIARERKDTAMVGLLQRHGAR